MRVRPGRVKRRPGPLVCRGMQLGRDRAGEPISRTRTPRGLLTARRFEDAPDCAHYPRLPHSGQGSPGLVRPTPQLEQCRLSARGSVIERSGRFVSPWRRSPCFGFRWLRAQAASAVPVTEMMAVPSAFTSHSHHIGAPHAALAAQPVAAAASAVANAAVQCRRRRPIRRPAMQSGSAGDGHCNSRRCVGRNCP